MLLVCIQAAVLAACAGNGGPLGEQVPHGLGGLPADTPARPAQTAPYPAVYDLPPDRPTPPLTDSQQLKLEQDLATARARQQRLEDPNAGKQSSRANAAAAAARDKARAAAGKKPATEDSE
jgi:hypothetical protein